jgi:hypothetical protein
MGAQVTISYAQKAMTLSEASGDILLQLSAYTKVSWAYLENKHYPQALKTMQKCESVLQRYQHGKSNPPLPPGMIGNFYSGYAMAQAGNGISTDHSLGIAAESEPLKEQIALVEFTATAQWLEAAWACSNKGDSVQTMKWIGKRLDLETLVPCVAQSKLGHIQAINLLTRALLQSKERDMDRVIATWTVAIESARELKSERLYSNAMANFEGMRILWSGERAIAQLFPLTAHW